MKSTQDRAVFTLPREFNALNHLKASVSLRLITVGVAVLAISLLLASFIYYLRSPMFADFEVFYSSALAVRYGDSPYKRALEARDADYSITHPSKPRPVSGMPYVYPPPFALFTLPLTFLPLRDASVLWHVFNYVMLVGTSIVLVRLLFPDLRRHRFSMVVGLSAAVSITQPIRAILYNGQVDILLLLLMTLSLVAFVSKHDLRAGVWLGLALSVKPFLGMLLLFYMWKGAFRSVAAAILVSLITLGFSLLIVGHEVLTEFVAVASYLAGPIWSVTPVNQSVYGLLLRLFSVNPFTVPVFEMPILAEFLRGAFGIVVMGGLAVLVSRSRLIPVRRQVLEYGLFIIAMLLVSPVAQPNHYAYLVIPILALIATWGEVQPRSLVLFLLLITIYLYLSLPGLQALSSGLYFYLVDGPLTSPGLFLTGAHLYALFILAALSAVVANRLRQTVTT